MNKIMENNEQVVDETTNAAASAEQTENTQGAEDTKDWKAEALKFKAIAERKDKKLQEFSVDGTSTGDKPLQNNTGAGSATIEHMALLAKDPSVEKVKYAEKVANLEGITLTEAYEGDLCQNKFSQMEQEAQVQANTMPSSGGSAPAQREKTPANMTDEEHRAYGESMLAKAINK